MSEPDERVEHEDDEASRLRERIENLLPSVIRRTVSTGVEAKQYTEDVIRGALQEVKLPREAVTQLIDVADNTKKEVVRVAAREFREFLESAKFNEELAKILTQLSFEIRTEIRFVPNDQALKPSVETSARLKTSGGATVDASDETTETINEAMRSNATELVEMLIGRVLRSGLKDVEEKVSDGPSETAPKGRSKKRRSKHAEGPTPEPSSEKDD